MDNDYLEELNAEYIQLLEKYKKLDDLIRKAHAHKLDFKLNCPISLLECQRGIMESYMRILEVRVNVFEHYHFHL